MKRSGPLARRTPLSRGGYLNRGTSTLQRTRIRPMSDKRKATNVIRRANVEAAYGTHPECAACAPLQLVGIDRFHTGCRGWADDAHEPGLRGRGADITDPDQCIPVSRQCHDFIHDHPDIAEAAGLLLPTRAPVGPRSLP